MKRFHKLAAMILALVLLLTTDGVDARWNEIAVAENAEMDGISNERESDMATVPVSDEVEVMDGFTGDGENDVSDDRLRADEVMQTEEGASEEDHTEESESLLAAPEVVVAQEWEYDEGIGAITIPYVDLPETLSFEWTFDGMANGYAVQTAPVPAEDNPEIRSERIYTDEPHVELPAADYSEEGWFSLYVIAMLEDGTELEGWKYFRLEQMQEEPSRANASELSIENAGTPQAIATSISLNKTTMKLREEEFTVLKAVVSPSNACQDVIWTTEDDEVANFVIDADEELGDFICPEVRVKATQHIGKTTITCTAIDGSGVQASCDVEVIGGPTILSMEADKESYLEKETIEITVRTTSDARLLVVNDEEYDDSYVVTERDGIKTWKVYSWFETAGEHTVTCKASDNVPYELWAGIETRAYGDPHSLQIKVEEKYLEFDATQITLMAGLGPSTLTVTAYPTPDEDEGNFPSLLWTSSDSDIVLVYDDYPYDNNDSIQLIPVAPGDAMVTCSYADGTGREAQCYVTVKENQLRSVEFSETSVTMKMGETIYLDVITDPADALQYINGQDFSLYGIGDFELYYADVEDIMDLEWMNDGRMKLTARGWGKGSVGARFDLTMMNGERISIECDLTVQYADITPKKVSVASEPYDGNYFLTPIFEPEGTWSEVKWSSSNKKIATVDEDGYVEGKKNGTVTITAKAKNGGKKGKIKLKIEVTPTKIELDQKGTVTLDLSDELVLGETVYPLYLDYYNVTWSSSNKKIAEVSSWGCVTPKKVGTVTITVKTKNGKKASVKVKVVDHTAPTKVSLEEKSTLRMKVSDKLFLHASVAPTTAVNAPLTWSSSNKKIVSVDQDGCIHALKKGTVTITVKTKNGKKAKVKVKVS